MRREERGERESAQAMGFPDPIPLLSSLLSLLLTLVPS
jgi:hypothetical protein